MTVRLGLVGARGYTGEELLRLVARHPGVEVAWLSSRTHAGRTVREVLDDPTLPELTFETLTPESAPARGADAVVLALPNGALAPWVEAFAGRAVVLDLSADHRFDDDWAYGLPELGRDPLRGAHRIANPGCYATAAQLALAPLAGELAGAPSVFGVSGYSGAGRTPSPRNDPERLRDNLLPYALAGHVHEREISHRLGTEVRFMPHVAAFFRGISLTVSVTLRHETSVAALHERFAARYAGEPLVRIGREVPEIAEVRGRPHAAVGGFTVDERDRRRASWVACLDNLQKGAASQALQNLNLACGLDETAGLTG